MISAKAEECVAFLLNRDSLLGSKACFVELLDEMNERGRVRRLRDKRQHILDGV